MTGTVRAQGRIAERARARQSAGVVLPAVKTAMLADYEPGAGRRSDVVHPSELAKASFCPRAAALRITGHERALPAFDFGKENIFDEGHSIHAKWQSRLRRAVGLWGDWRCVICGETARDCTEPGVMGTAGCEPVAGTCPNPGGHIWEYAEVTLDVPDALIAGHADGAFGTTLVEFKSIGEGTARIEAPALHARHVVGGITDMAGLWRDIQRPFASHLRQADVYLWLADYLGLPFRQMSFVYECKWNQQCREFVVPYSERRSTRIVDKALIVRDALEAGKLPRCREPGNCGECAAYQGGKEG